MPRTRASGKGGRGGEYYFRCVGSLQVDVEAALNRHVNLVAIAYVMHKTPYVFPIVGGRKVEHLKQNIQALDISLSTEQIHRIDGAKLFNVGFPHDIVVRALIPFPNTSLTEYVNRGIAQQRRRLVKS